MTNDSLDARMQNLKEKVIYLYVTKQISNYSRDTALEVLEEALEEADNTSKFLESSDQFLKTCIFSNDYDKKLEEISDKSFEFDKNEMKKIAKTLIKKGFFEQHNDDKYSIVDDKSNLNLSTLTNEEFAVYNQCSMETMEYRDNLKNNNITEEA